MRDAAAARRYATALTELSIAAGQEDQTVADLAAWGELLQGEGRPAFEALNSPVFSLEERQGVLNAVAERLGTSDLVRRFLSLLIDRGRIGGLPDIVAFVTQDLDARAGRLRVEVRSAFPLDAALQQELAEAFGVATGKTVLLETQTDPELLGGLVARLGSKVYDASLRTRLHELKRRLIHAQPPAEA